jgi:hypothetical protein
MKYEEAQNALSVILDETNKARQDAENLRAILNHATVQLKLWQEHRLDDQNRRAELFKLIDDGTLRLSVGGGRCVAEIQGEND